MDFQMLSYLLLDIPPIPADTTHNLSPSSTHDQGMNNYIHM